MTPVGKVRKRIQLITAEDNNGLLEKALVWEIPCLWLLNGSKCSGARESVV